MLICQISDLHVRPPGLPSNRVVESSMLTERALRHVAALRPAPDCVIVTGDLADCGLRAEYAALRQLLDRYVRVPCYVLPGNHDRRELFRAAFADYPGVCDHPARVQYAIDAHPVRLVCLDSVVPGGAHGLLGPDALAELDATLAADRRPSLVALHHPPFACGMAFMDRIALADRAGFASVIARHPHVRRVIAGHHHRALIAPVAHAIGTACPSVAHQSTFDLEHAGVGTLNLEPPAYQLHRVDADGTICTHTVLVDEFPGPFPYVLDADYPGHGEPSASPAVLP